MSKLVWVPSATHAWEAVQLVSSDTHSITVRYPKDGNREAKLPMPGGSAANLEVIPDGSLAVDCANLVDLESFSEGNILHHIRRRFESDVIYTFVGDILIALNPYKSLQGMYEQPVIDHIYQLTKSGETCPPHVFSTGAAAVFNMRNHTKDQSVLISGESGAGKTEATKRILQFVSSVCGSSKSRVGISIENQILDSNPLLESFGNAKTIRNNNSSRFGKYMEINFDKSNSSSSGSGSVKGCNVTAYLLEKSRVVRQGPNERNYHVFYMLLAGADKALKGEFHLKPADQFAYLLQSGCLEVTGRSDAKEFEDMVFAMNSLAIDFSAQHEILQLVAAVLHIGNLQFAASRDGDGGSRVATPQDCRRIVQLLGLTTAAGGGGGDPNGDLERALCCRQSVVKNEIMTMQLSPEAAADQRDALAKFVYGRVFDSVVACVNSSLFRGKPGLSIGVLDIFGFEVFHLNSFEQLCINYCNERLQTFFNEVIFEGEMKLYAEEGLPCDDISYQDNVGCVRLIDLRGAGIFAYLDEEIVMPKGSDEKFVSKLNSIFDEHSATRSVYFSRMRKHPLQFAVRHFAGEVTYNATDFMEKNKDALAEALLALVNRSSLRLLQQPTTAADATATTTATATDSSSGNSNNKRSNKLTLAAKFKKDLDSLMSALRSTAPHFIRCVKPNSQQKAALFDGPLALDQLKYSGLFEAIRIRKAGYALRLPIDGFIRRYKHCYSSSSSNSNSGGGGSSNSNSGGGGSSNGNSGSNSGGGIPAALRSDPRQYAEVLLLELDKRVDYSQLAAALAVPSLAATAAATAGRNNNSSKRLAASTRASRASMRSSVAVQRQFAVGVTRVFIRSQQYQQQLDRIRENCRGNCAIPLQQIVRGFLVRRKFQQLQSDRSKRQQQQRVVEAAERQLMAAADAASATMESAFRSDSQLQHRLADAKRERIKLERERVSKLRAAAALLLQKRIRGLLQRRKGRIFMCEQSLEKALTARDEQLINRAIQMPEQFKVSSKLIRMYQHSAKQLILEVLSEAYVASALEDAVTVGSIPLLQQAIHRAVQQRMPYLPQLQQAQLALQRCLMLRSTLYRLEEILVRCISVPKLIAAADELQQLVQQAMSLDLAREFVVQDAAQRLHRVRNLLQLRDRMRFAVEMCCPSRMKSAMQERAKQLRIYGGELLAEERTAIVGMFRMLNYQQHVDISQLQQQRQQSTTASIGGGGGGGGNSGSRSPATAASAALSMHELYEVINELSDATATTAVAASDIYLPPFVSRCLEAVKRSSTAAALEDAMEEYQKLVPDDLKRQFYSRIFKWVVAFATWKFSSPRQRTIAATAVDANTAAAAAVTTNSAQSEFTSATAMARAKSPDKDNFNTTGKVTGFFTGNYAGTTTGSPVSPRRFLKKGDGRYRSSPVAYPPGSPQLQKSGLLNNTQLNEEEEQQQQQQQQQQVFIPFSQRQAKSHVAAHEILKKGKQQQRVDFSLKTDATLQRSIDDYDRFVNSELRTASTFRG